MKFYKTKDNKIVLSSVEQNLDCLKEITANTTDGALEKHVPFVKKEGNKILVDVGEVLHPMLDNHYIEFILLKTNKEIHIKELNPGDEPKAVFELSENEVAIEVYEYCNLHGLWKTVL